MACRLDRELLGTFDALLLVVLGLVLHRTSARDPGRPPELLGRVGDLGWTPNRVAALGLNLLLLVDLARVAQLSIRFLAGRDAVVRLERFQTSYLTTYGLWAAAVVVLLPPLFGFA